MWSPAEQSKIVVGGRISSSGRPRRRCRDPSHFVDPLLRRENRGLVHLRAQKGPTHLEMPQQTVRLCWVKT
jgi:hypothetical protein